MKDLRALAHPLRLRILSLATAEAISATDVARSLHVSHSLASYHLRHLEKLGALKVVDTTRIRGGQRKLYRAQQPYEADPELHFGPAGRPDLIRAISEELQRKIQMHHPDRPALIADAELWLHPDDWTEIRTVIETALRHAHAAARPPHTPGATHVSLTAAAFETHLSPPRHSAHRRPDEPQPDR